MIWALFIGLVVGIVAKFFMPGRDPGGIIITCLLGIAGAAFAQWAGAAVGIYSTGEPAGFISAVFGAMVLLYVYRLVFKPR
ncbi:MAG: GlsB/YeaQ/YmgE family stress response membrane protein [Bdellovibrionota bacterium]